MSKISVGKNGEQVALDYLEKQGYKIIETNKHFSRQCEIDIIALDKDTLVFCEVKTRTTTVCGVPFESITRAKYQHIKTGLYLYLQENPAYKKFRIDVISVTLNPELKIEHLKNL
ncbi:MAG: YraN family protein [Candidatus Gastranaerophilales bacterium]|nr:YraN family protein [Candidatus Gastranaerophilales bacterium]MCM1072675.1 YraN family protein [Bacteroides sp.]